MSMTGNFNGPGPYVVGIAPVSGAGSLDFEPYKLATFGDSRSELGPTGPDVSSGTILTDIRSSSWAVAQLGDCELARNYGVASDLATAWNAAARTGGKTFLDLDKSSLDLVIVQYGINDCVAGTATNTIVAALKALCSQILKSGKKLVFEAIHPVRAPVTAPAATQAAADAVNAAMQSWIATLPQTQARYADTATLLKGGDGYAQSIYFNPADGVHLIANGGRAAAPTLAAAIRALLPAKTGLFLAQDPTAPNLLNLLTPDLFTSFEVGTGAATTAYGQDARGYYVEWVVTPATFVSGENRARLDLSANFQTANPPYYALAGNEILQGAAQLVVDNGAGGAPNAYSVCLRQRFYTGAVFSAWGLTPAGVPGGINQDLLTPIDHRMITPRVTNAAASVVASPAASAGYQLQIYVTSQSTTPYRVRAYNPQLRRVGWSSAVQTLTPPASAAAYTNTMTASQQVIVSGGTVSAIAINGTATGLTSGVFVLRPGDTLTPTYTVAPTMLAKMVV